MAKSEPKAVEPETTGPDLAAENAELKAQLESLRAAVAAQPKGALVSPAELERMLGTDNPSVRQTEAQVHPGTGKPYFNDLRPTGRA
jgi:hypothetical protein